MSALRSASPVLRNPANRHWAVPLTYEQFHYGFANALDEDEAKSLYEKYAVPGSGEPIFQAAAANLNPWTPKRGHCSSSRASSITRCRPPSRRRRTSARSATRA